VIVVVDVFVIVGVGVHVRVREGQTGASRFEKGLQQAEMRG
jgi:hypothetical protein